MGENYSFSAPILSTGKSARYWVVYFFGWGERPREPDPACQSEAAAARQ
jgi:hypothetical protein